MRLRRLNQGIGWREAFIEIFLIFIGINLSIWFNNWNQERKERRIEIQVLEELQTSLSMDMERAEHAVKMYTERVYVFYMLVDYIENKKPMDDSLIKVFPKISGLTYFLQNRAAYESYKSKGLELIENDSLRLGIIEYYETEIKWLQFNLEFADKYYDEHINTLLLGTLTWEGNLQNNYNEILRDKKMLQVFKGALLVNKNLEKLNSEINAKARLLSETIAYDIKRLTD